jgi:putative phosphoesterase
MKLGLISDIHADLNSLQLALALLHDQRVDQIICAGDAVEKGPHGNAVVCLLQAEQIACVAGNHDRQALADEEWHGDYIESVPAPPSYFLDSQSLDWLRRLPQTLDLNVENNRVCVAHGTPANDMLYVFPTSRRRVFEKVVRQADADVLILGHTHIPMLVCMEDTWICNPGSVCGTLSSGSSTCATLTLPHCQFNFFNIATGMRVMPHHVELGEAR